MQNLAVGEAHNDGIGAEGTQGREAFTYHRVDARVVPTGFYRLEMLGANRIGTVDAIEFRNVAPHDSGETGLIAHCWHDE